MPTTCGFPNCKFRSRYRGCEDNRHFYRVPKKPLVLRNRWLEAIGRTEETIVSQLRVCSGHFQGGEKREGDIPVSDPAIDAPLRIELPPKTSRPSNSASYKNSLKFGPDSPCLRGMHGNSVFMRGRGGPSHKLQQMRPLTGGFPGKPFFGLNLSPREQHIAMNYLRNNQQMPFLPSGSIPKAPASPESAGMLKNRCQAMFEQLQQWNMKYKQNESAPNLPGNPFINGNPLFQALLRQSGFFSGTIPNPQEAPNDIPWPSANVAENVDLLAGEEKANSPENLLKKLRMNALGLMAKQQGLPQNGELPPHIAGGKRVCESAEAFDYFG
ncbi:hypothetical protein Ciccas_007089 [Cichlidogyrus casuarinus]|uniref:THAP-type domain-containing protein n=1 Tax=Cichlidogyrus casuarinus TaxID=1844966 RepID=A0ABD2Q3W2_9PLAT